MEVITIEFEKYQHIERFGTTEVEGIEIGTCYVFPKIDGTNGSLYMQGHELKAGSRNRELTLDKDNAGFYSQIITDERYINFFRKYPELRLFGEFLVPHSLKTYENSAWRKFYIFDVMADGLYLSYEQYKEILEEFNIEYIPPIAKIKNPTYEDLIKCLEKTNYLIQDGKGLGEGVVIKNYNYKNKYGRVTWAKIVRSEFKAEHTKVMGVAELSGSLSCEERILDKYVTEAFIEKEYSKIVTENNGWNSKNIPMLFGKVYYELIKEESWNFIKEFKNPKIDFSRLYMMCIAKIKEVKKDLF